MFEKGNHCGYPFFCASPAKIKKNSGEGALIEKRRYLVEYESHTFEVDEFFGQNEGLTIAEVELSSADEAFERPEWLGREVTGQKHYYNSHLRSHPYSEWSNEEQNNI